MTSRTLVDLGQTLPVDWICCRKFQKRTNQPVWVWVSHFCFHENNSSRCGKARCFLKTPVSSGKIRFRCASSAGHHAHFRGLVLGFHELHVSIPVLKVSIFTMRSWHLQSTEFLELHSTEFGIDLPSRHWYPLYRGQGNVRYFLTFGCANRLVINDQQTMLYLQT